MPTHTFMLRFLATLLLLGGIPASTAADDRNVPVRDTAGFDICVPQHVTTVIPMVPSITQVLIDLGLGDRIIAMDTQSALLHKPGPDIPVFNMLSPDIEALASLRPSLLLVSSISMIGNEDPFMPLKKMGICVAYVRTSESLRGIKDDLRFIADVTGRPEEGTKLIAAMDADLQNIALSRPVITVPLRVYFEIAPAPAMYSFGKGVFLNEMVDLTGAENIFADREGWIRAEAESIVSANPDIIFTNVSYGGDPVADILSRPGWENVKAVRNKRVYALDNTYTSLPNHNVVKGIREMMKFMYHHE